MSCYIAWGCLHIERTVVGRPVQRGKAYPLERQTSLAMKGRRKVTILTRFTCISTADLGARRWDDTCVPIFVLGVCVN